MSLEHLEERLEKAIEDVEDALRAPAPTRPSTA